MRIDVDRERCQGHNRCFAIAPDLFVLDEDGYSSVVGDGTVPPDLEDDAAEAVENCPEEAVRVLPDRRDAPGGAVRPA